MTYVLCGYYFQERGLTDFGWDLSSTTRPYGVCYPSFQLCVNSAPFYLSNDYYLIV